MVASGPGSTRHEGGRTCQDAAGTRRCAGRHRGTAQTRSSRSSRALTEDDDASPAEWFWLRMTEQVREEKFAELFDWVETVLRDPVPRLPRRPDQTLLAQPPRGQMGTVLALPAVVPYLPSQTTSPQRRRRLARPLVPRRAPPPRHPSWAAAKQLAAANPAKRLEIR